MEGIGLTRVWSAFDLDKLPREAIIDPVGESGQGMSERGINLTGYLVVKEGEMERASRENYSVQVFCDGRRLVKHQLYSADMHTTEYFTVVVKHGCNVGF